MSNILIIVSTFNRRDLTGITLDAIKHNRSAYSDVVVLDDASTEYDAAWLARWGFTVRTRTASLGVGGAARMRYLNFLAAPAHYRYCCMLDNDLLLCPHFDLRLLELWNRTQGQHTPFTLVTGYRSVTKKVKQAHHDWLEMETVGGACHFVDRSTALRAVMAMPSEPWEHTWDFQISRVYQQIIAPMRSFVQHLGIYGSGVNGISDDVAFNYD